MKYHLCNSFSWESGQDVSSRFGPQQTGGTIIQHVCPVDLQASMAQGADILTRWAMLLAEGTTTDASTDSPALNFSVEAEDWRKITHE